MGDNDPDLASFADAGTEQDALAEYLLQNYADSENAYSEMDSIEEESLTDEQIIRTN